jgi:hypothetical protein
LQEFTDGFFDECFETALQKRVIISLKSPILIAGNIFLRTLPEMLLFSNSGQVYPTSGQ